MTELWIGSLTELSPEQIRKGFGKYLAGKDCKFPPKPGQVIELSGWEPKTISMLTTERQREENFKKRKPDTTA